MSAFNLLRPNLQSLSVEEPSLVSLVSSVYETVHASKGDKIAHNAARCYPAMMFKSTKGLLGSRQKVFAVPAAHL